MKYFLYGVAIGGILFCPLSGTGKVRISEALNIQLLIGNPSVVLCLSAIVFVRCIVVVRFSEGKSVERGPTV